MIQSYYYQKFHFQNLSVKSFTKNLKSNEILTFLNEKHKDKSSNIFIQFLIKENEYLNDFFKDRNLDLNKFMYFNLELINIENMKEQSGKINKLNIASEFLLEKEIREKFLNYFHEYNSIQVHAKKFMEEEYFNQLNFNYLSKKDKKIFNFSFKKNKEYLENIDLIIHSKDYLLSSSDKKYAFALSLSNNAFDYFQKTKKDQPSIIETFSRFAEGLSILDTDYQKLSMANMLYQISQSTECSNLNDKFNHLHIDNKLLVAQTIAKTEVLSKDSIQNIINLITGTDFLPGVASELDNIVKKTMKP